MFPISSLMLSFSLSLSYSHFPTFQKTSPFHKIPLSTQASLIHHPNTPPLTLISFIPNAPIKAPEILSNTPPGTECHSDLTVPLAFLMPHTPRSDQVVVEACFFNANSSATLSAPPDPLLSCHKSLTLEVFSHPMSPHQY